MATDAIALSAESHWRWQILAEWVFIALLAVVLSYGGFARGWRALNTDFPNDYLVASLYRHHNPLGRIYEWDWLQHQNNHLAIPQKVAGFAPHPPTDALPLLPLALMPALQAKRVWLVLNVGFLGFVICFLKMATDLGWRRVVLITLLCSFPLQVNFWLGQFYIVTLLLICAAYHAFQRGYEFTSGFVLSIAASLKLFPFLFILFFARGRAWRAALGLIVGAAAIFALSVALFGIQAHRVYLLSVLPRTLLGDVLSPYSLQWNSFAALWHRAFLFEPELNPVPILNSTALYVLAQVVTLTGLTFAFFCLSASETNTRSNSPAQKLEWASFVSLLLLLSPMPAPYQYCLLAFTAALGIDAFLAQRKRSRAVVCLLLVVLACAHFPSRIERALAFRLAANLLLYLFLLYCIHFREGQILRIRWRWATFAAGEACVLAAFCTWTVQGRTEDLLRHIPNFSAAYRSSSAIKIAGGIACVQSNGLDGYHMAIQRDGLNREITLPDDALALSANPTGSSVFSEIAGQTSVIALVSPFEPQRSPEIVTAGQQPTVSSQGQWLALLRDVGGRNTVWLFNLHSRDLPRPILSDQWNPMEATVLLQGDVIASVGTVTQSYLVRIHQDTGDIERLDSIRGPARYPSISPDGQRLAFSRSTYGVWRLVVRDLASGVEQELTHGSFNAVSPSWADSRTILYDTDSGRGLGLTAIASITLAN